jgi:diketogulonate reductase-like aldo/keto reductase
MISRAALLGVASAVQPQQELSNGVQMPMLALGVYQYNDSQAEEAILAAFDNGFSMIDGGDEYHNNAGVGRAIQALLKKNVSRDDIWIQAKVQGCAFENVPLFKCYEGTKNVLEKQLTDYGLDFVDSMILHFPPLPVVAAGGCPGQLLCPLIENQWRAVQEFYKAGKARAVGVSNYCKDCYDNCLKGKFEVMPHIHQISYHLGMGKDKQGYVAHAKENGMALQAYSTLANKPSFYIWEPKGINPQILSGKAFHGKLGEIAQKHNRSTVQMALKWVVDKNMTALTKSSSPKHLLEDSDLWSFQLDDEDREALDFEEPWWPKAGADHGLHGLPAWACHPPGSFDPMGPITV